MYITVPVFETLDFSVFSASPLCKEGCHHFAVFRKDGVLGTDALSSLLSPELAIHVHYCVPAGKLFPGLPYNWGYWRLHKKCLVSVGMGLKSISKSVTKFCT